MPNSLEFEYGSHEQSETRPYRGKWRNIYGPLSGARAGQPLPLLHPWERELYDTKEEAIRNAERRAKLFADEPGQYEGPLPWPVEEIPRPADITDRPGVTSNYRGMGGFRSLLRGRVGK